MREPGEGAVDYAKELVAGLSQDQAREVIRELLRSTSDDPRVKKCTYCGYLFRDKTRPGNAKVCGPSCKSMTKTRQKRVQRARGKVNLKQPLKYYFWLEYPFWISEKDMLNHAYSYEKPYDHNKLLEISAAKDRDTRMGGKRKAVRKVQY